MKKILVISDTHNYKKNIEKLMPLALTCDYVFHLGDYITDMDGFLTQLKGKLYAVRGNCDGGGEDAELTVENVKILLTHGDKYKVKSTLYSLSARAMQDKFNLVCFGHTHTQEVIEYNGITFVNPGSLSRGGGENYAIITIDDGKVEVQKLSLM